MKRGSWYLAAAVAVLCGAQAVAQYQKHRPWPSEQFNPPQDRNVAGQFDYYALVLSWSPTYCSESDNRNGKDDQQCNRSDGRRFSFVLHGLWPQYERGYPGDCRTARRPFVPQDLINRMLDIMPSPGLIIHEYRKHGTCSGLDAELYFGRARQFFQSIKIPERFKNPFETQFDSPAGIVNDFVRANPTFTPQMIAVACGGSGNRLKEIRFCFSKDGKPRACGENENPRQLCRADRMFIPPVRSTARDSQSNDGNAYDRGDRNRPGNGNRQSPLPGPREPAAERSL